MLHIFVMLGVFVRAYAVFFDGAISSSVYNGGSKSIFAASLAKSPGAGFWCSSGDHLKGQVVSWTGLLAARRMATGLSLSWENAPDEFQVLVSPDGANFVEAVGWHPSSQKELSFTEHVMFEHVLPMRAVAVVMRGPRGPGYFGLKTASLFAEPAPSMLVSGVTSVSGEKCVVAMENGVGILPCLDVLAAGGGEFVFQLTDEGRLLSVANPGKCVQIVGNSFVLGSCRVAANAVDGSGSFKLLSNGQLQVGPGQLCVAVSDVGLVAENCDEVREFDGGDKFFMLAVPEINPAFALAVHDAAKLAVNAGQRLAGLIGQLNASLPLLDSCAVALHRQLCIAGNCTDGHLSEILWQNVHHSANGRTLIDEVVGKADFVGSMNKQLGVGELSSIISRARAILSVIQSRV